MNEIVEQKFKIVNKEDRYLDPKSLRGSSAVPRAKTPFTDAVVFMVGGGNYIKNQKLQKYARSKNQSRIRQEQKSIQNMSGVGKFGFFVKSLSKKRLRDSDNQDNNAKRIKM